MIFNVTMDFIHNKFTHLNNAIHKACGAQIEQTTQSNRLIGSHQPTSGVGQQKVRLLGRRYPGLPAETLLQILCLQFAID